MKKSLTLRSKLLILYVLLAIVPLLCVAAFSYYAYSKDTRQIEQELLNYSAALVAENISGSVSHYRKSMAELATDSEVLALSKNLQKADGSIGYAQSVNELSQRFRSLAYGDNAIEGITFLNMNLDTVTYDRQYDNYYSKPSARWVNRVYKEQVFALCPQRGLSIVSTAGLEEAPSEAGRMFCLITPVVDWVSNEQYGCLVLEISESVITSMLDYQSGAEDSINKMSECSCVTDGDGNILVSLNAALVGESISLLDREAAHITSSESAYIPSTGLTLHLFFVHGSLDRFTKNFIFLVSGVTLLIGLAFFLMVNAITRRMIRKADSLATALDTFGSEVTEVETFAAGDEMLSEVDIRFHQMTRQIRELLAQLEEKNRTITQEADNRRRSEIRALQAQINPHFLYNALDRINWMALENNQDEISEMLSGLGSLLRYSISNIDIQVPLQAEVEWMKKYIYIQNKRMDCEILFSCQMGEEEAAFPIYKMLLQPLVENALVHGIAKETQQLHIRLLAQVLPGKRLSLRLENDGVCMAPQDLRMVRGLLSDRQHLEYDRVGLGNVVNRLVLYYGQEGQISVDSSEGAGTAFTLIIPYQ